MWSRNIITAQCLKLYSLQ